MPMMAKWKAHDELQERMGSIIREFGLNQGKAGAEMRRSIGDSPAGSEGRTIYGRQ